MTAKPTLFRVDQLDLTFAPKPWPFAQDKRAEIAAFFAEMQQRIPALWNGRVLLMYQHAVRDGVFRGDYLETDYASFLAWRRWGSSPVFIHDCFGAGAVVSADNAVILGVMGEHTANAGRIYFPAGTPDPSDIIDGKVDLGASVTRELREETGCDIGEFRVESGWTTVVDGGLITQIKTLRSAETAESLRARILKHLARDKQPELSDIRVVRGRGDFDPAMPPFVVAFLEHHFDQA